MAVRMTKRYISPQSGPVDIKTNKDSHSRSQEQETPKDIVVEAYTPSPEEARMYYDPSLERRFSHLVGHNPDFLDAIHSEFDRMINRARFKAWDEGWNRGVDDANFGPRPKTPNPYESEEA